MINVLSKNCEICQYSEVCRFAPQYAELGADLTKSFADKQGIYKESDFTIRVECGKCLKKSNLRGNLESLKTHTATNSSPFDPEIERLERCITSRSST